MDSNEREFRLSLTIQEDAAFTGAHATLALMSTAEEDGQDTPMLAIMAGGFSKDAEGAGELADMLRDAADAIDDHLGRPRPHHDTATLPVLQTRPRFNPRPRGAQ